jgi:amidase
MALANELAYVTATELAARIRRRELSPVEVVDAFIERIQSRNDSLNALVYLGLDDARQRAREAEQALVSGVELGVLHGVPPRSRTCSTSSPAGRRPSAASAR